MKSSGNKELLNTQMNVKETDSKNSGRKLPEHVVKEIGHGKNLHKEKDQLVTTEEIEGTPFTIVNIDKKGWFVALGNRRITEPVLSKIEVKKIIERKDWNFIATVIGTILEIREDIKAIELVKDLKNQEENGN